MSKRESAHEDAGALTRSSGASTATSYFTPHQWCVYGLIIAIGLLLRWFLLDMRPYHHDESLHDSLRSHL